MSGPGWGDRLEQRGLRAALADSAARGAPAAGLPAAAVLVALVDAPAGVLLTRRAAGLRRHAGQVAFPGGRIDPGDADAEAAALREAQEEIGLAPERVAVLGRLPGLITGTGYHVIPVVGRVADASGLALAAAEVACVFVLPRAVLCNPAAPTRRRMDEAEVWVWPHADHLIWGATAAMLVSLAALLGSLE